MTRDMLDSCIVKDENGYGISGDKVGNGTVYYHIKDILKNKSELHIKVAFKASHEYLNNIFTFLYDPYIQLDAVNYYHLSLYKQGSQLTYNVHWHNGFIALHNVVSESSYIVELIYKSGSCNFTLYDISHTEIISVGNYETTYTLHNIANYYDLILLYYANNRNTFPCPKMLYYFIITEI